MSFFAMPIVDPRQVSTFGLAALFAHEGVPGQAEPAEQPIHHERRAGQVAGVLEQADQEEQQADLRQEHRGAGLAEIGNQPRREPKAQKHDQRHDQHAEWQRPGRRVVGLQRLRHQRQGEQRGRACPEALGQRRGA